MMYLEDGEQTHSVYLLGGGKYVLIGLATGGAQNKKSVDFVLEFYAVGLTAHFCIYGFNYALGLDLGKGNGI
jgi:hypothetical protein